MLRAKLCEADLRLFPSAELFVPCFADAKQTHYPQSGVLRTQPHIISQGACFEAHSGCGVELRCAKSRKAKLYILLMAAFYVNWQLSAKTYGARQHRFELFETRVFKKL